MARKIEVEIVGDARSFNRALGSASGASSRLSRVLHGAGKAALYGAAGAAGVALTGLGIAAKVGFSEFRENARVTEQLRARIKSTGGVANVTVKSINALAQATLSKTGIDDEATKAADAMLLSFKNVHNEVGKGNDVFDQASVAIADMATAYNDGAIPSMEQLSSTAVTVGKALNDPILGLGRLKRVGVDFNQTQIDTITHLVETGRTMEAQKLILHELTTEFGGSAEAAGRADGGIRILTETFKNLAAEGVAPLMPHLRDLTSWVTDHLPQIRKVFRAVFNAVGNIVGGAASLISRHAGTIKAAFDAVRAFLSDHVAPAFKRAKEVATKAIKGLAGYLQDHRAELLSIWESLVTVLGNIRTIAKKLGPAFKDAGKDIIPAVQDIASAIATLSGWLSTATGWATSLNDALVSLPGGSGGGGLLDIIPGANTSLLDLIHGHKAAGGPVGRGRAYVVGERGPEVFVPGSNGNIIPNGAGGGGSVNVIVLGGDREAIDYLRRLDVRQSRRSGRGVL
jgi:hypothetical protein